VPLNEGETEELYAEAATAFGALATFLGTDQWFSGEGQPGLLDAAVFAYTHLLLLEDAGHAAGQQGWQWSDHRMREILRRGHLANLREHRERILELYYHRTARI
jgi:metaxin